LGVLGATVTAEVAHEITYAAFSETVGAEIGEKGVLTFASHENTNDKTAARTACLAGVMA
jgi:propanediol dehydratase large subunit